MGAKPDKRCPVQIIYHIGKHDGRVPVVASANTLIHAEPVVDVNAILGGECPRITETRNRNVRCGRRRRCRWRRGVSIGSHG